MVDATRMFFVQPEDVIFYQQNQLPGKGGSLMGRMAGATTAVGTDLFVPRADLILVPFGVQ